WKEFDGKQSLIQLMHSTDQGNTWQAVTTLATSDGASDHPLLISDGNTAWLSWNTARQDLVFMAIESDNK
ncbi:MAG TPA: exo-alpha-sialidase, partial [Gammaproteobacteria bacterium]|nr:exo-alpha-sialidase [Gammaproteobacteria bacterium]